MFFTSSDKSIDQNGRVERVTAYESECCKVRIQSCQKHCNSNFIRAWSSRRVTRLICIGEVGSYIRKSQKIMNFIKILTRKPWHLMDSGILKGIRMTFQFSLSWLWKFDKLYKFRLRVCSTKTPLKLMSWQWKGEDLGKQSYLKCFSNSKINIFTHNISMGLINVKKHHDQ